MTVASRQSQLTVSDGVVCAELGDEAVLLNVETGVYFGLDSVGHTIWTLLVTGHDADQIERTLLQEFEVDANQLQADVANFLGALRARGLVREVAA